ncbi:unnamed protein product [Haemonchus placei]|uniref:Uncharacterized protein n=1 Tax=Haemonchus placei TaxID=6290 RepID=A0A0N4X8N0_HAEPC|nr:unnamed protein product [Haemonchus placei]
MMEITRESEFFRDDPDSFPCFFSSSSHHLLPCTLQGFCSRLELWVSRLEPWVTLRIAAL